MNYPAAELRGIKMNFYLINPDAEHRGILLIKTYTPGKKPEFIEGHVFKTIIPIEKIEASNKEEGFRIYDTLNATVGATVNDTVKRRLVTEILFIIDKHMNAASLAKLIDKNEKTIKRDMRILREAGLVCFVGAAKTGHYEITDDIRIKFSK